MLPENAKKRKKIMLCQKVSWLKKVKKLPTSLQNIVTGY